MNIIDKINAKQINPNVPDFRVGDTVRVDVKIIEGKRERIQAYEGVVVARRGGSVSETFTVRKMSSGIGVERTFPINSPKLAGIAVVRKGKVRRAKLNFLKEKVGSYRIKERGQKCLFILFLFIKIKKWKLKCNLIVTPKLFIVIFQIFNLLHFMMIISLRFIV